MKPSQAFLAALFGGFCFVMFVAAVDSDSRGIRDVFLLENLPAIVLYTPIFTLPVGGLIWAFLRGGWRAMGVAFLAASALTGTFLWALGGNRTLTGSEEVKSLAVFIAVVSVGLGSASALPILFTAWSRSRSEVS